MDFNQVVVITDKNGNNPIQLQCKADTVRISDNEHYILNWTEIMDKIKEHYGYQY